MTDPLASSDPGSQRRRSTRIVQAVPVTVTGVDALGQPFKERTTTTMVNCHGCKYQSKHYVPKNSTVTLEIPRPEANLPARKVAGRVVWVQRPRTVRELFQIGLEFEIAGNVWGIAFPPDDWFPLPDEQPAATAGPQTAVEKKSSAPTSGTAAAISERLHQKVAEMLGEKRPQAPALVTQSAPTDVSTPKVTVPAPGPWPAPADQSKVHAIPAPAAIEESQAALARHVSKLVTDAKTALDKSLRHEAQAAINDEMTIVRQQLDVQLHDAVEKAIKLSMERVSESAVRRVVQDAADRTAAIVEEARKAGEAKAEHLDAKIRQAVEQAVSGAAEQAAQQAAQQTAALNLSEAVQHAVERAIAEREASSPSLHVLSSPEAAQKQIENWKNSLEETAQGVRQQAIEKTEADAAGAARRWEAEFENTLKSASQKLNNELSEVSQSALERAEQDVVARNARLRASLDETVTNAQSTMTSLGADLARERARAEITSTQLQHAAKAALERAQSRLDEALAQQLREADRKANEIIAERARQIDPMVEQSARKVADRVSNELDQKVSAKLEETRRVVSDLADVRQQVEQSRESIRTEMEHASDQAARLHDTIREEILQASEQAFQLQGKVREQVGQASETAIQDALGRIKAESGKYPAELEQACREVINKVEAEFEQKSTAAEHATYEALLRASEWYQKKAHTTMQSSLEKAVEQSTAALRDRAAEISSLVASELDHYRRTYLEHSRGQIEESAKELVERERGKLTETAEVANAAFTDRVHRTTEESLRRVEHSSRETIEKALSDMEFNREEALAEFQKRVDDRILHGIEQAQEQLQSQLLPLIEQMEGNRQAQMREWIEHLQRSTDESVEQYKMRLENASNSWLLASATTLGQHSQAVLDTLAKAAEKRLKDTCRDVLAGMGETLKQRMLGLSGGFESDEDDDLPPK